MIDKVTNYLDSIAVKYQLIFHPRVVTTEQSRAVVNVDNCIACKSLYVKDKKSPRCYLMVLAFDKRAEMRQYAELVGTTKFEFATEQQLQQDLGVTRGSVSPFAFLNGGSDVMLILDKDILDSPLVKFHPCDNSATVVLSTQDFVKYLNSIDKKYILV